MLKSVHDFFYPPPPPPRKGLCAGFPTRAVIALMMFFTCWVNYMMRVNMSMNIIAMVPDKPQKPQEDAILRAVNDTMKSKFLRRDNDQPSHVTTFTWTVQQQGYVLSGYFWGYAVSCLIGGTAAEFVGPKRIILFTTFLSAGFTMFCPAAAKIDYIALIVVRLITGFGGGFLFPALHTLVANWAPPLEKGKFVSSLLGGSVGTCVTWSLSGLLIHGLGWEYGFYIPGAIALAWCFVWSYAVYDKPTIHPRISAEEKKYILDSIGDRVSQQKRKTYPPFLKMLTSIPFLAMVVLHFGSNWGLYFIMTAAPKYMSSVLGFNLRASGVLSSLPYISRMVFSLVFGIIGDKIQHKNLMPLTFMRKFFAIFSHVIPGCFLMSLGWARNAGVCVAFIALALAFNGAACLTNLVNHQDLAPNYAGTLFGLANGIGNSAGFITPMVTGYITREGLNTIEEWRPVFILGGSVYMCTAAFFMIFGTSKTQAWNKIPEHGK